MMPFDPASYGRAGEPQRLLEQGAVLRTRGIETLFQDIMAYMEMFCQGNAFNMPKDQNPLRATGAVESCVPAGLMPMPL